MTLATIIKQAEADGVRIALSRSGDIKAVGKGEAVYRWLPILREHKAELLDELRAANERTYDIAPNVAAEARRQRVLAMLGDSPTVRFAILTDTESDPHAVIVALAIRGRATCELLVPRAKWDGVLRLDLIERHCMTMH